MDRSTSNCMTNSGEFLLLFHHFFAIYLYLGSFFFDPFIHLIVATLTIIHWYTYGKCILTEYTNIYCSRRCYYRGQKELGNNGYRNKQRLN